MQVELYCPHCSFRFAASPETRGAEVVNRLIDMGIWYGLGDGETFEDMIFNTLTEHGDILCPECHEPVHVAEESLSLLAREMLSQL